MPCKVLILYNEPVLPREAPDAESEWDVLTTVEAVHQTLCTAGHAVSQLGINNDPRTLLDGLQQGKPNVVFNLFEGTADRGEIEAYVDGVLEWLNVPYTGCTALSACLARDKALTKCLLRGAGLPTAAFLVVEAPPVPQCPLPWPVIVKPAGKDASVGIDQGSVVTEQRQLIQRVELLLDRYRGPVLIEQFIAGRELNVGVIAWPNLRALPLSEILFLIQDPGYWPIVSYDAKWKEESRECIETPPRCPADVEPNLAAHLQTLALQAFQLLGCRDYARIDFRVDAENRPFLLEVNPNPDLNPHAGFTRGLTAAGISHPQFILGLVDAAQRRGGSSRESRGALTALARGAIPK